jgi:xanthosine utilization system XapX-like protein
MRIFVGAGLVIGLIFLLLYLRRSPGPPGQAVSGDESSGIQF